MSCSLTRAKLQFRERLVYWLWHCGLILAPCLFSSLQSSGPGYVTATWWMFVCQRAAGVLGNLLAEGAVRVSVGTGLTKLKTA